ncbi:hypothetical protein [Paraburkholderia hospita]|nr:hypothetical protein [Paraburkholderia hospita]
MQTTPAADCNPRMDGVEIAVERDPMGEAWRAVEALQAVEFGR